LVDEGDAVKSAFVVATPSASGPCVLFVIVTVCVDDVATGTAPKLTEFGLTVRSPTAALPGASTSETAVPTRAPATRSRFIRPSSLELVSRQP